MKKSFMQKNNVQIMLKASFTIEASVIVPLTLFILLAIILLSFYVHDKVILSTAPIELVLENQGTSNTASEDAAQQIKSQLESDLSSRLITSSDISVSLTNDNDSASINVTGSFNWHLAMLKDFFPSLSTQNVSINISNLDARARLLKYKILLDGKDLITGGSSDDN